METTTTTDRQTLPEPDPRQRRFLPQSNHAAEGQRHLMVSLAALVAVVLVSLSIHGVLDGWGWLLNVMFTAAAVLTATAGTRSLRWPPVLSLGAGLLTLAGVLVWQFFRDQSFLGVIPGSQATERLASLLENAETTVASELAPVAPGEGVLLITCAATGLAALLIDTLAITCRMPATSGIPLLAVLSIPAIILPDSVGVPAFTAAAAGYIFLLATGQWRESFESQDQAAHRTAGYLTRAATIGAGALSLALVLPAMVPGFTTGTFPQGSRLQWWTAASGLDPSVTLGNSLREPDGSGRITYATTANEPLYLRLTTLEDFSGRRWHPDQRMDSRRTGIRQMGMSAGLPVGSGNLTTTRIDTRSFTSPWLLAPYAPLSITGLNGAWTWDPGTLTVLSTAGETTARQTYQVISSLPELTPELLAGLGPAEDGEVDAGFSFLPEGLPPVIRQTAVNLTADLTNPYSKAMAIQNYLRGGGFTYSLQAPVEGNYDGTGLEVIGRFLEVKAGYCVHFAGAMAVMARLAGIPSRVAVGYAPGEPTGNTVMVAGKDLPEFAVDSKDAHAWPELYFRGAGWVRFEPTPSRGVVPVYAQQPATPPGLPVEDDLRPDGLSVPDTATSPTPAPGLSGNGTPGTPIPSGVEPGMTVVVLVLLFLAAAPFLIRAARSGGRKRRFLSSNPQLAAGIAWAETTESAVDHGYTPGAAETPRAFTSRLMQQARFNSQAVDSLTRLRHAFEIQMYAAAKVQPVPGTVSPTWADVQEVKRALWGSNTLPARLKARLLPRSLRRRY
ncbi:transglutaminase domain-containing protein [Arthrobacter sp. BB-1]|uniref:transglutaminase family protein n=1 Tax=unclassified Arthrobacter TaxID=235627 RepID=UPI0010EF9AFC|nr:MULTISPECIES: DUF3488 and transglutaminase-like domain-containing protein [unclassified Arthrobacter]TNB75698.1 transglutaminase domain-containing protein [Arthrobacter sp. BB-1]VII98902.1 FIG001454: Transglutaminase-like enzymes, putative cysteine proteases [Arthrobacter sp. DR-2P]